MQFVIAKAAAVVEQKALAYGAGLLMQIARIRADAEHLQAESERRQDVRAALRAIHERLAIVELEAKLCGEIETGQKNVTINLQTVSREEALQYAQDILDLFGPRASSNSEPPVTIEGDVVESTLSDLREQEHEDDH